MSPRYLAFAVFLPGSALAASGPELTLDDLHGDRIAQAAISQTIHDPTMALPDQCLLPHDVPVAESAVMRLGCLVPTGQARQN